MEEEVGAAESGFYVAGGDRKPLHLFSQADESNIDGLLSFRDEGVEYQDAKDNGPTIGRIM